MNTATLEIHICNQRRSYRATFSTQEQAIAFLTPRRSTHAFWEIDTDLPNLGGSVPADWTDLLNFLYPLCEHEMSLDSCYGPNHFMDAAQEMALWG